MYLYPKIGLYPAGMEIPKYVLEREDPWSYWNLCPGVKRRCLSSSRGSMCTGVSCHSEGHVMVQDLETPLCHTEVTPSPGRARRKHFPSSIFLKKGFAAAKQSTMRNIKQPDCPGTLLLH